MVKIMNRRLFLVLSCVVCISVLITLLHGSGRSSSFQSSSIFPMKLSASSFYENMHVTKKSSVYEVNHQPSCFISGCNTPNNQRALRACNDNTATRWNRQGVKSLNRWMNLGIREIEGYNENSLEDAFYSFLNATSVEPNCPQATFNLASTFLIMDQYVKAYQLYNYTLSLFTDDVDISISNIFMGVTFELMGRPDAAEIHYNRLMELKETDTSDLDYFGIAFKNNKGLSLNKYGNGEDAKSMRNFAIFKYFSDISVSEYGIIDPGTQDFFIENRYIVLRRILHPFILNTAAQCYRSFINAGVLKFGDGQSQRYSAYNDRCARFLHYHIADFVRKVIAHNARPSYTYFGGYKGGSELRPHLDRAQCEYTMSLTLDQKPYNETWLLSLGKKPVGKHPKMVIPPEDEIVDADLYMGDALLFMGRTLIHFRRGQLTEGSSVNQVFLHFVQENFEGPLN